MDDSAAESKIVRRATLSDIVSFPFPRGNGALKIPSFGLGTFRAAGSSCYDSCLAALHCGYRLIDTAALYENEDQVGAAVKVFLSERTDVSRQDLFIVTKLHWDCHGAEGVKNGIEASLKKLQLDYIDLYLIHSPKGGKVLETWAAILNYKKQGLCRHVGVSNFGADQLNGLCASGLEVPEVNQIELHLWNQQRSTVTFCREKQILVMGYCPLARGEQFGKTPLTQIARQLGVSEADLCIYWCMKNGFICIPKSTSVERLRQNYSTASELRLTAGVSGLLEGFHCAFEASIAVQAQKILWDDVK